MRTFPRGVVVLSMLVIHGSYACTDESSGPPPGSPDLPPDEPPDSPPDNVPLDAPPDEPIAVEIVTANGSGCPAGTTVEVRPDNTAFTVTFSDYVARAGAGSAPTDFRKNCQLNLRVQVPDGFSYSLTEADYRGFASLADGASAAQRAHYFFQGQSQTLDLSHMFTGPLADDWQTMDRTAGQLVSPCGVQRNLNIDTELIVTGGSADPATTSSWIAMDAAHGSVQSVFSLGWRRCP